MTESQKTSEESDQRTTTLTRERLRQQGARKIPREELIRRLQERRDQRRDDRRRIPTNH